MSETVKGSEPLHRRRRERCGIERAVSHPYADTVTPIAGVSENPIRWLSSEIVGGFAAALVCHAQLAKRVPHEGVCWTAAFAVLVGLGNLGNALF